MDQYELKEIGELLAPLSCEIKRAWALLCSIRRPKQGPRLLPAKDGIITLCIVGYILHITGLDDNYLLA